MFSAKAENILVLLQKVQRTTIFSAVTENIKGAQATFNHLDIKFSHCEGMSFEIFKFLFD